MSKCTKNSQTAMFALAKRSAGVKSHRWELKESQNLSLHRHRPNPKNAIARFREPGGGPPPSSEGGEVNSANNVLLTYILAFLSILPLFALGVQGRSPISGNLGKEEIVPLSFVRYERCSPHSPLLAVPFPRWGT